MSIDISLPRINAQDADGQLVQLKSYVYQLVEQLNWALNNIDRTSEATITTIKEMAASKSGGTMSDDEAVTTFNSIKSLIIKSADIVNSYSEQISTKLAGDYVTQSDFGTYRNATSNTISANSESISQLYSNQQSIDSDLDAVQNTLSNVQANIKTGLLYTDTFGNPVYGLEVGQRDVVDGVETFNKYARFTSNRLSFYDQNDAEVAYISDYRLYITNAQITGELNLGRYVMDTSMGGITFKWK